MPFSPVLRKTLLRVHQLREKKQIPGDYVLAGFGGVPWEKRNATTSLHLLLQKLRLPRFGWHRLRHTFATNYLRQGGDIVRLAMVLGHSQITTTQRYLHLLTSDLVAIRERVMAGLQRARAQGKRLGRPRVHPARVVVPGGSVRAAAAAWGVSKTTAAKWIAEGKG